jgi:hypothetical protein
LDQGYQTRACAVRLPFAVVLEADEGIRTLDLRHGKATL